MFRLILLVGLISLCLAVPAYAQSMGYWRMVNMNNIAMNNLCNSIRENAIKAHRAVPDNCKTSADRSRASNAPATAAPAAVTAKFSPVSNAESFEQIAASISSVPQEKELIAKTANIMKSTLEDGYSAKGWKNNVAGALAYFATSMLTVYFDKEPSEAVQIALFDAYNTAPEFASASNKDKQTLYNALLTFSGMPLLFYIDGKNKGDAAQVQKAKALAAHNFKTVLRSDPEILAEMMK